MADIVLKDRNGKEISYPGVNSIRVKKADGETHEFVDSEIVPQGVERTIALDFSGGDMVVTPGEGAMFSKVTVQKPDTLIPENIPEGMDIAGIIGKLMAGGGGGAKFAIGQFTGSDAPETIAHGLGVVPDFVMVAALSPNTSTTARLFFAYAVSNAVGSVFPSIYGNLNKGMYYMIKKYSSNSSYYIVNYSNTNYPIENAGAMGMVIHSATETSFVVGPSGFDQIPASGCNYAWIAIAGLT